MPAQQHSNSPGFGEARLDALQRHSFEYFLRETNATNGLVADKSQPGSPASIAAVGFALAAYPVGVLILSLPSTPPAVSLRTNDAFGIAASCSVARNDGLATRC